MKTFIAIFVSMMLTASFSTNAESQGHAMHDAQDGNMMGMLADDHSRSMMMDQIVKDSEMRQEMMHKMMQSTDMPMMMNDPEMKARLQKHIGMMQLMLDSEGMDQAKMKEMMDTPEMKSIMKMHMMCAQVTIDGMMEERSMENEGEHDH